jgi:carbon-monoxide dehydrogenase large subunit
LRVAGYAELRREQAERLARGDRVVMGIGVSSYVEITAGGGGAEFGSVTVNPDGSATIRVGTSAHGQGHATSFAMIVADRLQIPLEQVNFIDSDTAEVPTGGGTGGSRSLQLGGSAVLNAAEGVVAQAREVAATMLEANPDDIVVMDGGVGVVGVPASALTWAQLTQHQPLMAVSDFRQDGATFPFGAHVAVVDVDLDTGRVTPVRHIAVDDCGRILNPLIVAGQQHGGIAQGMAQALWEQYVYDADGNPLTSTLADYAMPSAAEMPSFEASNTETPSPRNELGAKGIGESGTIGSTPAVQSAVVDALRHLGIRHIDIPCTAERVWTAIRDAEAGHPASPWREPPSIFDNLTAPTARADAEAVDI